MVASHRKGKMAHPIDVVDLELQLTVATICKRSIGCRRDELGRVRCPRAEGMRSGEDGCLLEEDKSTDGLEELRRRGEHRDGLVCDA